MTTTLKILIRIPRLACHKVGVTCYKIPGYVCHRQGQDHGGDDDVDDGGVAVVIPALYPTALLRLRARHHHPRDPADGQNQREHWSTQ